MIDELRKRLPTGTVGSSEFSAVHGIFVWLLTSFPGVRHKQLATLGADGRRWVLDRVDECDEDEQRTFTIEIWHSIRQFPIGMKATFAVIRGEPSMEWVWKELNVSRCLFDQKLHFGMSKGQMFCRECEKTIKDVGLDLREVREKIRLGQKIS